MPNPEENEYQYVMEQPSKWSLKKICQSTWHHKWWALGFTVGFAIAGYLAGRFVVNPMRQTVSSTFTYDLMTTTGSDGVERFADGTVFNYASLLSSSTLENVKASDQDFANIDVDELAKDASITLDGYEDATTGGFVEYSPTTYILSFKLSPLKDEATARKFVEALTYYPVSQSITAVENYSVSDVLTSSFDSLTLENQVSTLLSQYSLYSSAYSSLSSFYGSTVACNSEGQTLSSVITEFNNTFVYQNETEFSRLLSQIEEYDLFNYTVGQEDEAISSIESIYVYYCQLMKSNVRTIALYEEELATIWNGQSVLDGGQLDARIATLSSSITSLKQTNIGYLDILDGYGYDTTTFRASQTEANLATIVQSEAESGALQMLQAAKEGTEEGQAWAARCASVKEDISEIKSLLTGDIKSTFEETYQYVHKTYNNNVNYSTAGIISVSGAISPWLVAGGLAVVVFILTVLIVTYIDIVQEEEKHLEEISK